MGSQVVTQPDGRLAVWSTIITDWVVYDATPEEVIEFFVEIAAEDARRVAQQTVDAVMSGDARSRYRQFTKTFEELQELRAEQHGSAPWPPVDEDEEGEVE